jgi:hypothetical protein
MGPSQALKIAGKYSAKIGCRTLAGFKGAGFDEWVARVNRGFRMSIYCRSGL